MAKRRLLSNWTRSLLGQRHFSENAVLRPFEKRSRRGETYRELMTLYFGCQFKIRLMGVRTLSTEWLTKILPSRVMEYCCFALPGPEGAKNT